MDDRNGCQDTGNVLTKINKDTAESMINMKANLMIMIIKGDTFFGVISEQMKCM